MTYRGELRSGASNDPEDWVVAGPSFGEYGPPPSVIKRIVDDIMANDSAPSSTPLAGGHRNRHLDAYGGRQNA